MTKQCKKKKKESKNAIYNDDIEQEVNFPRDDIEFRAKGMGKVRRASKQARERGFYKKKPIPTAEELKEKADKRRARVYKNVQKFRKTSNTPAAIRYRRNVKECWPVIKAQIEATKGSKGW